jgi:hypothetical protein
VRWGEHVARAGDIINAYIVLVRKSEGKDHLVRVNQDVDGKMKCSCTLREQNMAWNGFN